MIAVLAALEIEISGLRRHVRDRRMVMHKHMRITEGYLWTNRHALVQQNWLRADSADDVVGSRGHTSGEVTRLPIVLVASGMGRNCAELAAEYVLTHYQPTVLVIVGFGGAIIHKLAVGDVVICAEHYGLDTMPLGQSSIALEGPIKSDHRLVDMARRIGAGNNGAKSRLTIGATLTVPEIVTDRRTKEWLGWQFAAIVVDMESYWAARLAAERRVPLLTIRAVSDTLDQPLPDLSALVDAHGRPRPGALWRYLVWGPRPPFATHPSATLAPQATRKDLWLLGMRSRQAARELTRMLLALFSAMSLNGVFAGVWSKH